MAVPLAYASGNDLLQMLRAQIGTRFNQDVIRYMFFKSQCQWICIGIAILVWGGQVGGDDLRLNQIQTIGTHNSYHLAPPQEVLSFLALGSQRSAEALDYSHRPIAEQLGSMKVRQLEFDLYADPQGGLFSNPVAYRKDRDAEGSEEPDPNAGGLLDQPGFKVLHSVDFDYRTTTATFVKALQEIREWSKANPRHIPILVLVELKDTAVGPVQVKPVRIDSEQLAEVDKEIRSVFSTSEMILPDDVRADCETLREAIKIKGWPKLNDCRGRVWFALDNEGALPRKYLDGHPSLRKRVMFVSMGMDHPASAFLKLNDPVSDFERIQHAVRAGFIVRTRADSETVQARQNDISRRDRAFESGAQYISTDYPVANERLSDYRVCLPGDLTYRVNPLAGRGER